MNPSKKELRKILYDKESDIISILDREGYNRRLPSAAWYYPWHCLAIAYSYSNIKKIPDNRLRKILDGTEKVLNNEMKLIKEWYAISNYRYGYEIGKVQEELLKAANVGNEADVKKYRKKQNKLIKKYEMIDIREIKKRQLAYYYRERGERLERLYNIIEGENEAVNLRFGCVDAAISATSYKEEMLKESYEASKGFFEDLNNTYSLISKLQGKTEVSPSTGIAYSNEWAYGKGNLSMKIGDKTISLEARISKDGMKNQLKCILETSEVYFNKEDALKRASILLPDYIIGGSESFFRGGKDDSSVKLSYFMGKFLFSGEPKDLEEEIPRFMQVVLG